MEDTAEETAAYLGFVIAEAVIIGVLGVVLPLELWSLVEYWKQNAATSSSRSCLPLSATSGKATTVLRMRVCLFLNGVFAALLAAVALVTGTVKHVSPEVCEFLARIIAMIYLVGMIFAYLFLLLKVRLVNTFETGQRYVFIAKWMERLLAAMMPVCLIMYGVMTTGQLTNEGRCMQIDPQWSYWLFSIGNVFLSGTLVYLFAKPLYAMAEALDRTHSNNATNEFRTVYRRNVCISSFAVWMTFWAVLSYGVLHFYADLLGRADFNVIGMALVGLDSFVLAVCCRLTTFMWLPNRLQRVFQRRDGGDGAAAGVVDTGSNDVGGGVQGGVVTHPASDDVIPINKKSPPPAALAVVPASENDLL